MSNSIIKHLNIQLQWLGSANQVISPAEGGACEAAGRALVHWTLALLQNPWNLAWKDSSLDGALIKWIMPSLRLVLMAPTVIQDITIYYESIRVLQVQL